MTKRFLASGVFACALALAHAHAAGQAQAPAKAPAITPAKAPATTAAKPAAAPAAPIRPWTSPRTADGQPDLQGYWSYATITPLERPNAQGGKSVLTNEEVVEVNEEYDTLADRRVGVGTDADVALAYNQFWWDRGKSTGRTSLIVDPENGKLPPLTAEAQKRIAAKAAYQRAHPSDSAADRNLQERCIMYHGVPPLPTGYNNHYQIFQTAKSVAILDENIHDVRTIPVDGRPHLPSDMRQWLGDSRGHWEGETLVVETTNYSDKTVLKFPMDGKTTRSVERFTRVAPDRIDYRFTINDPATYAKPWTAELPLTRIKGPLFEYACHEGNYGMLGILSGARAQERAAEQAAKKGAK